MVIFGISFEIDVSGLSHTQSELVVTAVLSVREQVHWLFVAKRHSSGKSKPKMYLTLYQWDGALSCSEVEH